MGQINIGNVGVLKYPLDGADVSSAPTNKIPASSMQHSFLVPVNFGLQTTDTPVGKTVIAFLSNGGGSVTSFKAFANVAGSSASVTVDLQKNGVSILSAPITITNATGNRVVVSATISSATLVDGDVLTCVLAVSSSTGMSGVSAQINVTATQVPV